jgi:hypothetical protein
MKIPAGVLAGRILQAAAVKVRRGDIGPDGKLTAAGWQGVFQKRSLPRGLDLPGLVSTLGMSGVDVKPLDSRRIIREADLGEAVTREKVRALHAQSTSRDSEPPVVRLIDLFGLEYLSNLEGGTFKWGSLAKLLMIVINNKDTIWSLDFEELFTDLYNNFNAEDHDNYRKRYWFNLKLPLAVLGKSPQLLKLERICGELSMLNLQLQMGESANTFDRVMREILSIFDPDGLQVIKKDSPQMALWRKDFVLKKEELTELVRSLNFSEFAHYSALYVASLVGEIDLELMRKIVAGT